MLLILLAAFMAWKGPDLLWGPEVQPRSAKQSAPVPVENLTPEDIQKRVDAHLKKTYQNMILQRGAMEVELKKQLVRPGDNLFKPEAAKKEKSDADKPLHATDEAWVRLAEPLDGGNKKGFGKNPQKEVYQDLAEQEAMTKAEQLAKRKYIWQFRRNAWLGGYDVKVDAAGNVVSVRPLGPAERRRDFPEPEPTEFDE